MACAVNADNGIHYIYKYIHGRNEYYYKGQHGTN